MVDSLYDLFLDHNMAVVLLNQVELECNLNDFIVITHRVYHEAELLVIVVLEFRKHGYRDCIGFSKEVVLWRDIVDLLVNKHVHLLQGLGILAQEFFKLSFICFLVIDRCEEEARVVHLVLGEVDDLSTCLDRLI